MVNRSDQNERNSSKELSDRLCNPFREKLDEDKRFVNVANKSNSSALSSVNNNLMTVPITTRHKVKPNIREIHIEEKIGKGAYGTVRRCTDQSGNNYAVKCIECGEKENSDKSDERQIRVNNGIPCLMEASIMQTIDHPNINSSIQTIVDSSTPESNLYIVQELAASDLLSWRRNTSDISYETIIQILYKLCSAVKCFHNLHLVHGDIKASNVLINHVGEVKLADFTLSTKECWNRNYTICTSTHRPIEVWIPGLFREDFIHRIEQGTIKQDWDRRADIWSLGCTIFQIVYGYSLFPYQRYSEEYPTIQPEDDSSTNHISDITDESMSAENTSDKIYNRIHRTKIVAANNAIDGYDQNIKIPKVNNMNKLLGRIVKSRYISNIREFGLATRQDVSFIPASSFLTLSSTQEYSSISIPESFDPVNNQIDHLIMRCLQIEPDRRCTIKDIMMMPCFKKFLPIEYTVYISPIKKLPSGVNEWVLSETAKYTSDDRVKNLVLKLFARIYHLNSITMANRLLTSIWISHKLVYRTTLKSVESVASLHRLIHTERKICSYLSFRLNGILI